VVERFLNTADLEEVADSIGTPEELAAWMREHRLAGDEDAFNRVDVQRARAVRESLRGLTLANNGGQLYPIDLATLNEALAQARLRTRFLLDGGVRLEPEATGSVGALGRILAVVVAAMADGSWRRLKACRKHSCRYAFYDHSKNLSGTWCSMAVCGNRVKVSRFRRRQKLSSR